MAVKIQLYGQLKQMTGSSELESNAVDSDELVKDLAMRFLLLDKLNYIIAVDRSIIQANTIIKEGQELALLPPYSGG